MVVDCPSSVESPEIPWKHSRRHLLEEALARLEEEVAVAFCIEMDLLKWGAIYEGVNVHNQVTVPLVEAGTLDSIVMAGTWKAHSLHTVLTIC